MPASVDGHPQIQRLAGWSRLERHRPPATTAQRIWPPWSWRSSSRCRTALLDSQGFLNGLASEVFHYSSGHRGYNEEPSLPQFLYYARHFASEFGTAGLLLGALGLGVCAAEIQNKSCSTQMPLRFVPVRPSP